MRKIDLELLLIARGFTPDDAGNMVRGNFKWALGVYNRIKALDKGRETKERKPLVKPNGESL